MCIAMEKGVNGYIDSTVISDLIFSAIEVIEQSLDVTKIFVIIIKLEKS